MCFQPLTMTCARPLVERARPACSRSARRCAACATAPRRSASAERRDERSLLDIDLDDHAVVVNDRRAGKSPLRVGHHEEAGVEQSEVLLPDLVAFHVVGVEPFGAEERQDVTAVGGERRAGVGRLGVPLALSARRCAPCAPTAACPCSCRSRSRASGARRCPAPTRCHRRARPSAAAGLSADRAGRAHLIAPDDRARVREARDGHSPFDVLVVRTHPRTWVPARPRRRPGRPVRESRPVVAETSAPLSVRAAHTDRSTISPSDPPTAALSTYEPQSSRRPQR